MITLPELSLRAVRRIITNAGADRISNKAVEKTRDLAEKFIVEVTRRALIFMEHANRRTLKEEDILNAIKLMFTSMTFL